MKSFLNFIIEARKSQASSRAEKLGLVGNGHGGWLDRSGKEVARTVNGQLEFLDARQRAEPTGPKPDAVKPAAPTTALKKPTTATPKDQLPPDDTQEPEQEEQRTLTVVFGRFNPPTIGHEVTLNLAKKVSVGGDFKIYPSRIQDPKKNPLRPEEKIQYMRKMFPDYEDSIISDSEMNTIYDVLIAANQEGYTNINIVCGADRQAEFENLSMKQNGKLYDFDEIKVISSGIRDDEATGTEGISASKMRRAVMKNDFKTFRKGTPKQLNDGEARALFDAVRTGMGLKKKLTKESYAIWEIAPEQDLNTLRENYIKGNIFKLGEKVQSLNTGLTGEVIRRGTNYIICVTEEGDMFKSWIKDLMEYTEVQMDSPMRDRKHPNTLVGTLGAFKHFASKTPGAVGTNSKNLQIGGKPYGVNFINKYKKLKESIYSNV
jgi:hypothetical protein